jgi:uncharacterized protein
MSVEGKYLGMTLQVSDLDIENKAYFAHLARHDFHLQRCVGCHRFRYPPTTGCPWCSNADSTWESVEGKGTVHSYVEVHQAIQPAFKPHLPYAYLLVDLDTQKGEPTEHESLRVIGNLVTPDGKLAPPEIVKKVGIGSRLKMVFADVGDGLSLLQWTLDDHQPSTPPGRYPER